MEAAGYVLTGLRKIRRRRHAALILAYGKTTNFFDIRAILDNPYPDFSSFNIFPATAALLDELRALDELAGQSSVDHFGCWQPAPRCPVILCTKDEARRVREETFRF